MLVVSDQLGETHGTGRPSEICWLVLVSAHRFIGGKFPLHCADCSLASCYGRSPLLMTEPILSVSGEELPSITRCCKTPKMPFDQFPANGPNEPQSPIDVASRPLPKSLVSSSLDNVVPQITVRSPRVRPGKFVFSDAKRLLQQNLPTTDILTTFRRVAARLA
jgi:hypothetical protein